jgi:hypothetical protein
MGCFTTSCTENYAKLYFDEQAYHSTKQAKGGHALEWFCGQATDEPLNYLVRES